MAVQRRSPALERTSRWPASRIPRVGLEVIAPGTARTARRHDARSLAHLRQHELPPPRRSVWSALTLVHHRRQRRDLGAPRLRGGRLRRAELSQSKLPTTAPGHGRAARRRPGGPPGRRAAVMPELRRTPGRACARPPSRAAQRSMLRTRPSRLCARAACSPGRPRGGCAPTDPRRSPRRRSSPAPPTRPGPPRRYRADACVAAERSSAPRRAGRARRCSSDEVPLELAQRVARQLGDLLEAARDLVVAQRVGELAAKLLAVERQRAVSDHVGNDLLAPLLGGSAQHRGIGDALRPGAASSTSEG